jgi:SET domain-containing protein
MRLIPTAATFDLLVKAYFEAKARSDDPHDESVKENIASCPSGVQLPLEVRPSKYGRGLFAMNHIPAHTAVYEGKRYGIFQNEAEWTTFLNLIPEQWHYDVAIWSYVMEWDTDVYVVALDFDEGSLINHGSSCVDATTARKSTTAIFHEGRLLQSDDGMANIRYNDKKMAYCTTRDVQESEEILCDYSEFHKGEHPLEWYTRICEQIFHANVEGSGEPKKPTGFHILVS